MKRALLAILFFVTLVAIWAALVRAQIWSPVLLPSPRAVLDYLVGAARDGTLISATLVTLRRLLLGYVIGLAIGLPLGLLTASSKFVEDTIGVLALDFKPCRASAGCRWPCFGSAKPKAPCCSS
jgi:NitT/TauT family transport system permease protein